MLNVWVFIPQVSGGAVKRLTPPFHPADLF
jgi:hypothetical protein